MHSTIVMPKYFTCYTYLTNESATFTVGILVLFSFPFSSIVFLLDQFNLFRSAPIQYHFYSDSCLLFYSCLSVSFHEHHDMVRVHQQTIFNSCSTCRKLYSILVDLVPILVDNHVLRSFLLILLYLSDNLLLTRTGFRYILQFSVCVFIRCQTRNSNASLERPIDQGFHHLFIIFFKKI